MVLVYSKLHNFLREVKIRLLLLSCAEFNDKMKTFFTIVALFIASIFTSSAQTISYYPFNSQLSFSTKDSAPIFLEARVQMNSATSLITTEIGPQIPLSHKNNTLFYLGGGASIGWFNDVFLKKSSNLKGYYGTFGVRSYPFEKVSHLGLNFEITPYTDSQFTTGLMRAWLGVSYKFK